jgi:hypothetical protein
VPGGILRYRLTEVRADAEITDRALARGEPVRREAAQQAETAPSQQVVADTAQRAAQARQRECFRPDVGDVHTARLHHSDRSEQFRRFVGRKHVRPLFRAARQVRAVPCLRRAHSMQWTIDGNGVDGDGLEGLLHHR